MHWRKEIRTHNERASGQIPFAQASHSLTLHFLIFFAISELHFFSSFSQKLFANIFGCFLPIYSASSALVRPLCPSLFNINAMQTVISEYYYTLNWAEEKNKRRIFSHLCECMYVVSEKWPCLVVLRGSWFLVERKNLHTPNIYAF